MGPKQMGSGKMSTGPMGSGQMYGSKEIGSRANGSLANCRSAWFNASASVERENLDCYCFSALHRKAIALKILQGVKHPVNAGIVYNS